MHNLHSKITKKNTPKKTHSEFVNTNLVKISKIQNKIAFLPQQSSKFKETPLKKYSVKNLILC